MSENKVILYYADWCGHCRKFKPTWEKLKPTIEKMGYQVEEYEATKDAAKIDQANPSIKGYPTIRIQKGPIIYDYNGSRQPEDIIKELKKNPNEQTVAERNKQKINQGRAINPITAYTKPDYESDLADKKGQTGGGQTEEQYKIKYYKYKAKYLGMLNELMN